MAGSNEGFESHTEAAADGAASGPDRSSHGFVDERHGRSCFVVLREAAALDDLELQDVEQLRGGGDEKRQLAVDRWRLREARHAERGHVESGERQRADRCGHRDAGQRADALDRGAEELILSGHRSGSLFELHEQHAVHAHPEVLQDEGVQAPAEHPGATEEHDRQRRLHQQERGCVALAASSAFGRNRHRAEGSQPRSRHDAADDQGAQTGEHRATRNPGVDGAVLDERREQQTTDSLVEPCCEGQCHGHGDGSDDRRLHEHLREQTPARRAEGDANRELPPPTGEANEVQRRRCSPARSRAPGPKPPRASRRSCAPPTKLAHR